MTLPALALAVLTFLLIGCALVLLYLTMVHRGLAALKREVDHYYSKLDGVLQERFEASGELMEACRGFIPRDASEMRDLVQVRSVWAIAGTREEKLKSAADSGRALTNLVAAAQAHPDLRPAEYFKRVEKRLGTLDLQVADRREKYNSTIGRFNTRLEQVRWMSGMTGFTDQPSFAPSASPRKSAFSTREDSLNQ